MNDLLSIPEHNRLFNQDLAGVIETHRVRGWGLLLADLYHNRVAYAARPERDMWSRENEVLCENALITMGVIHDVDIRDDINIIEQVVDAHGTVFRTDEVKYVRARISKNNAMKLNALKDLGKVSDGQWVSIWRCRGSKITTSPAGNETTRDVYYAFSISS